MKRHLVASCILLLVLSVASPIAGRVPRNDPQTGRIRVLYIGDAWGPSPYFHMTAEPSFLGTPIPATYAHIGTYGDRELKQFMRIYMPRRYADFIDSYDLVILSDTNRGLYTVDQLEWFRRGVEEEGIGMMMVGGIEAFGGSSYPTWGQSPVEEALPVSCLTDKTFTQSFKALPKLRDEPFIQSLPWETIPLFHGMNLVTPKEGSKILLEANLQSHPVLIYWEYGEGSALAHTPDWTPDWGSSVMLWDYYSDYVANMNYLNAGVLIPQNPELMHQIRIASAFTSWIGRCPSA